MTTPTVVEKQMVDIDLSGGMDESTAKESVDWTKRLVMAKNCYFNGNSIGARPGLRVVTPSTSDGTTLGTIQRLGVGDSGILAIGDTGSGAELWNLQESASTLQFSRKDRVPEFTVTSRTVSSAPGGNSAVITGAYGVVNMTRYQAIAHPYTSDRWRLIIVDKLSGQVVRDYIAENTSQTVGLNMVAVDDRYIHVYLSYTSGTAPRMTVIDTSSFPNDSAAFSYTSITGAAAGDRIAGVVAVTNGSVVVMRGATCRIEKFNNSRASVSNSTVTGIQATSLDIDGTTYCIFGNNAVNYIYKEVSAAYATTRSVTGPVLPAVPAGVLTGELHGASGTTLHNTRMIGYVREADQNGSVFPCPAVYSLAAGETSFTSLGYLPGWTESSVPVFVPGTGQFYVHMNNVMRGDTDDYIANCAAVINITTSSGPELTYSGPRFFRPEAVLDTYTASDGHPNVITNYSATGCAFASGATVYGTPYRPAIDSTGVVLFAHWSRGSAAYDSALAYTLDSLRQVATGVSGRDLSKVHIGPNYTTGGFLANYDGWRVQEHGFLNAPSVSIAQNATGVIPAGIYNYIVVFSYRDRKGLIHRSRCSRPRAITLAASKSTDVEIIVPVVSLRGCPLPSGFANNQDILMAEIYRTTVGGTQYYLAATKRIVTTPSSDTVPDGEVYLVVNDNMTDTVLAAQPLLYRQPGTAGTALDRYHALSSNHAINHKDRIFYAKDSSVYYSSFAVEFEAPWFSPAFYFNVPGGTGDITGLASMDGVLVIFKKDAVFLVDGDGPGENGGNGTEFSPPRRILTEFGCIDARTIVAVPNGIMYRSARGIEILDRSLKVSWIGDRVRTTVDSCTTNYGAAFDRLTGRVLFPMSSIGGSSLVPTYDIDQDAWSVAEYTASGTVQDFVYANSVNDAGTKNYYMYASQSNRLMFEDWNKLGLDKFTTTDAGCTVTLQTGLIKGSSKQDRIRVSDLFIAGNRVGPFNTTVSYAPEYLSSWTSVSSWGHAITDSMTFVQLNSKPPKELVQAMAFKIELVSSSTSGVLELFGISVRVGLKGGGAKVAVAQKG